MATVLYERLTPKDFLKRIGEAPIAYLPLGTLEYHGEHLPLGSDSMQSGGFFQRLAEIAGGVVMPEIFLSACKRIEKDGRDYIGMDIYAFPEGQPEQLTGSAYYMEDEAFRWMVEAIYFNLKRAGFKILVAHGHGGSTPYFRDHAREFEEKYGIKTFVCWRDTEFGNPKGKDGLGFMVDHAGLSETSVMKYLHPDLVQMENLAPDLSKPLKAVGSRLDPRVYASAELGRKIIDANLANMKRVLDKALAELGGDITDLGTWPVELIP